MENSNWQDLYKQGLKNIRDINSYFNLSLPDIPFEVFIPKNIAERIKSEGINSILGKQFIPNELELRDGGYEDPIGDQRFKKPGQIIHRYHNRVLFLPLTRCPIVCRYCFRKNELSQNDSLFKPDFKKTISYLTEHQEVTEVIFSGGDPFILSNAKIEYYLEAFSKIKNIKFIRFHTRTPISLPQRIDNELINTLNKYAQHFTKICIAIHVNHAEEIDMTCSQSLLRMKEKLNNIDLLAQTVLLKDINDNEEILVNLFNKLAQFSIRPYYLHHPDRVRGGTHFQVDIPTGRIIYARLRQYLPGWLIPNYVLDIPNGEGKIPIFNPESIDFSGKVINSSQDFISI